eukprot:GHVR01013854.1.p1 GENE.GHVR01013854.1~~GHVR01013854.1.p1  ORF type:complete len:185 (+),score=26.14 GHVR01013854.1:38-592(+)
MKALILVGGFGTRLRPLTFTKPKPLVEFCNMPIVEHQIKALAAVGVSQVILAVGFRADQMETAVKELEVKYEVKITISTEAQPMGTAGPIRVAKDVLCDAHDPQTCFFVFNSDIICDFPLKEMVEFHRKSSGEATIMVTRVADPSNFGVVVHETCTGLVQKFRNQNLSLETLSTPVYISYQRVL